MFKDNDECWICLDREKCNDARLTGSRVLLCYLSVTSNLDMMGIEWIKIEMNVMRTD